MLSRLNASRICRPERVQLGMILKPNLDSSVTDPGPLISLRACWQMSSPSKRRRHLLRKPGELRRHSPPPALFSDEDEHVAPTLVCRGPADLIGDLKVVGHHSSIAIDLDNRIDLLPFQNFRALDKLIPRTKGGLSAFETFAVGGRDGDD